MNTNQNKSAKSDTNLNDENKKVMDSLKVMPSKATKIHKKK